VGIVHTLDFAPDGRTLVTGSHDGRMRLWDTARGELIAPALETPYIDAVMVSPDGANCLVSMAGLRPVLVPMTSEALPLSVWMGLSECATGYRLAESVGFVPLSATELAAIFEKLRVEHPGHFVWPEDNREWHRFHAAQAEARNWTFTADFYRGVSPGLD